MLLCKGYFSIVYNFWSPEKFFGRRQEGGANLARKASPSQILTTQNYYLFVFGSVGLVWPGQEKGAEQAPPYWVEKGRKSNRGVTIIHI
jgi:hypothetical protein